MRKIYSFVGKFSDKVNGLGFFGGLMGMLLMGLAENVFLIVRISEPFWFLCACIMALPDIEMSK